MGLSQCPLLSPVLSWNEPSHPPESLFSTLPRITWEVPP